MYGGNNNEDEGSEVWKENVSNFFDMNLNNLSDKNRKNVRCCFSTGQVSRNSTRILQLIFCLSPVLP